MTTRSTPNLADLTAQIEAIYPWSSPQWHKRYALFSTHVGLAFPHVPAADHLNWFRSVIKNQQLMRWEEQTALTGHIRWYGRYEEMMELIRRGPTIICTFHTGSYRMINPYLLQQAQVPLSLLVSEEFIETESDSFGDRLRALDLPSGVAFSTISASRASSALQILRALGKGHHILGYVDGNMGSHPQKMDTIKDGRCELEFFGLPIKVRIGLAALAHRASVPLICVLTRRGAEHQTIFQVTRIFADPKAEEPDNRQFARRATHAMYRDLEALLSREPHQWDMWFHLRDFLF